jgi:hypothetical protein
MERARIMLIIAQAEIVRVSHHAIAGGATGFQINPPLKTVAISVSPTEIARRAIDIVSVLLIVNRCLVLALQNQECAISMSSDTMNTNIGATRSDLDELNLVQLIAKMLSILMHARNLASEINTGAPGDAVLIAMLDRLRVSTVINDKLVTLTAIANSLAVMIVISGHFAMGHDLIHRTHVGRVVRQDSVTIIQVSLMNLCDVVQSRSYSKATTSILMQVTLLSHRLL